MCVIGNQWRIPSGTSQSVTETATIVSQRNGPCVIANFSHDSANAVMHAFSISLVNNGDEAATGVLFLPLRNPERTVRFSMINNISPAGGSAFVRHIPNSEISSSRFDYPAFVMGAPCMGNTADIVLRHTTQFGVVYKNFTGTDYFISNHQMKVFGSATRYVIESNFLERQRITHEQYAEWTEP
jgi:hypothetical protein